jgi:hypothetical protein
MATIYGDIKGVVFHDPSVGSRGQAQVIFTMGAYTAASDNGQLGGNASAKLVGVSTGTSNLETILASVRRDGKTLNIVAGAPGRPGKHGSTDFYADTVAESSSNVTFELSDQSGTEINAASGVTDRPCEIIVTYDLS